MRFYNLQADFKIIITLKKIYRKRKSGKESKDETQIG